MSFVPLEERLAPAFLGGVNTALGDLDGDGVLDLVTAAGPGGGPQVTVFNGATGNGIRSFLAFDERFTGGVNVAVADVNGDGTSDIVVGAGEGGGPHVKAFDGRTNALLYSQYVYVERFRGGVNVGAADLDGDGKAEILTGAGVGGGPHVQAIDATTGAIRRSFYAYEERFRGGATVTAGDITGDGIADFMAGAGPGGGPHVVVFDGATGGLWASYYAYTESYSVGVRVAAGDVDGNGLADVTVAPMKDGGPHLRTFAGRQSVILDMMVEDPNYRGSLSAAVGDLDGDGFDDVMIGNGVGLPARVRRFNGYTGASGPAMTVFGDPPTVSGFATPVGSLPSQLYFDGPAFQIPPSSRGVSRVEVTPKHRLTPTQDEVGFYRVDDADGRVGSLLPDDAGYAAAALADDRRLPFAPGGQFQAELPSGGWYAHYLIPNSTYAEWAATNPANSLGGSPLAYFSFATANPDDTAHLRYVRERNRFAWENQTRGDDDTNDFIGELTLVDPAGPGNPEPKPEPKPDPDPQPPTISDILDQTISVGTVLPPLAFTVGDRETPVDELDVTFSADNPTLLPAGSITVGGSGANRTLTLVPATGQLGTATVTVTVTDADGMTASDTVTVTVIPLPPNTPPTISDIPDQRTVRDRVVGPLAFVIGDRETDPSGLTLVASSDNPGLLLDDAIVFGGSGANRTVSLTPRAGLTGVTTITVTVSDGQLTDSATFLLTVTPPDVIVPPTVRFLENLEGWTVAERGGTADVRGTVAGGGGNAKLAEGDSFVTTLSKSFVVPAVPSLIQFTYAELGFDTSAGGFVNDAFEAALVDAAGNPLVPVYAAGRDAFFNVTEGNVVATGSATSITGSPANISNKTISLNLSDVPAGTVATLVFRLVNNDEDTGSTVTLESTALPTAGNADAATKFYVVDDGADRAFRYGDEGLGAGQFTTTGIGNASGAASNPAGDRVWVVDDTTKSVTVFGPTGTTLGGWTATDAMDPQGITVDGGNLWLVDRGTNSVRRYVGGALLTSGTATATDTFALDAANAAPSDLVTDGGTVWVTDDATAEVFVYDVAGVLLGRWKLDGDNAAPSGITRNPAGGTDLWVLDRATKQVFQYGNGANLRTGQHTADGTFNLAPSNTSPEGIADPPQSPAGHSLLDPTGRAVFDTANDFREGTLFNLTAVDASGDIRLNTSATTEIPPFIWVSNSSEGTVSRFDTRTGVEVGRYRTGPNGSSHNPSRTAVAGDGSVWVANRAFNIQGSVVHVLLEDFIDRNGNGVVDTSTDLNNNGKIDANEILPWDANGDGQPDDERIALSVDVGRNRANPDILQINGVARAIAIDADDNVWVGLFSLNQYEVYSGETGEFLGVVPVSGNPYGAVIDGNGVLWSANRGGAVDRIDTTTRTALPSVTHGGDSYGISVGGDGAVWVSTYGQARLHRIDPDTLAVTTYSAPGVGALRGVGVSNTGDVWVASNSPDALTRFRFEADGVTLQSTKTVQVGSTASAAVIDSDGFVWTTTYGDNKAWKIDPETVEVVPGWPIATGVTPYNYSDMTGQVRLGVTQRTGTWTETLDAGRAGAAWAAVGLDALTPTDTSVVVRVRASDDDTRLPSLAWRTITPDTVYQDVRGRYLQVEVSLRSREPDFNPLVNSVTVTAVPAPTLEVFHPADGTTLPAETTFVLDGLATAALPEYGPALVVRNSIVAVTVNGVPVDVLDDAGHFYARVATRPGENTYTVIAYDEFGQTTTVVRTLVGETREPGAVDSSQFVDLTSGFKAEYGRTSYRQFAREMYADIAVRNISQYPAGVPLYVAVKNLSDPAVRVLNPAGTLADGTPYFDFTGLVTGGGRQLDPNALTGTLTLGFANPNRGRFTYDLVFLGVPNRPPAFTTIPELEATVEREYRYPAAATDPDGDPLTFGLISGPVGMAVDGTTGVVTWTPTATQVGNFPVTLRVSDGRGGTAEQSFTVVSAVSRPNRPPVFTTLPVIEAQAGQPYTYDADATDPDRDTLTYSLADGFPAGMTIDAATGAISWTPDFPQLGDAEVTIIADDGHGGLARQTFTICVKNDANRPPVIVSEPVRTARVAATASEPTYASELLEFFDSGAGPIAGPYGIQNTRFVIPVPATVVLGPPSPSPVVHQNPATEAVSLPTGSYITVGFGGTVAIDGPGNDIFVQSLDPADSANEFADVFVSADFVNFVLLGRINEIGNVGLDLATIGFTQPVRAVRVVGLDNRGASPGFELVAVHILPGSVATPYTYDVEALDPDGGPLTYSLTQKPDGMTINATTGVVSWAPGQDVANQSFPVTVRVDDGRGGSDEQKFTVTVKALGSTAREFDPVVEWQKDTFTVRPDSNQVMMTPAVIDLNGDGTPDIVFSTYTGGNWTSNGLLRAVSGIDGADLWTVTDSRYEVYGGAGVVVGDIDGDGRPEIIANHESNKLIAFEHDGTFKWFSATIPGGVGWGSAALADLDHDGTPEIVIGATVLNADGTLRWNGTNGRGDGGLGPLSAVADLDLDGSPEVVAGRTAYRADGTVYWNVAIGDGFPAIGNFDDDAFPEIVVVSGGRVYLLEHDGAIKWGPVSVPGGGRVGAPTVADFDNDGRPEIGVAGASRYVVFETDGSIKWQAVTQDNSSNVTGSSVFDFDGDGAAEVVYGDELYLRIYRGTDGTVLYELPKSSGTTYEYPVIADVDGDGNAEIVAVANRLIGGPQNGIYVIGDRNNTWVNARPIWNQHTYHITNVNDDGTIPANEANSWQVYNTYRLNVLTDGFDPRAAVDLVVASLTRVGTDSPLTFTARVENIGNAPVNAGATLALYDGDPMKGGVRVGTATTTLRLRPTEGEDLTVTLTVTAVNDLWAVVDPENVIAEFDDDNNALRGVIDTDPVNYAPRLWREITPADPTAIANTAFRLPLLVVDPDGDALTYSVVSGPDGLLVHPTLGVVAWVPKRAEIGTHQVVVKATDAAGNVTLVPFSVTVVAPNTAPVFTSVAPVGPATASRPFEYRATAQDAETPQTDLRFSLREPLPGMAIDAVTGAFTWTPTAAQVGTRTVNVVVTDGDITTEQTFTLDVLASAANRNPVIAIASADASAWLGRGYGAQVTGTDPDGDPVRFALVSGPAGMTLDAETGVVRWAPPAVTATETVTVRATDGRGGEATVSFDVSVFATDGNRAPRVVSVPGRAAVLGGLYAYDLKANDPDGDAVVWQLVSGPQGVSIDPLRGTLRWTPAADQTGPHTITVRVFDPLLAATEQTFTVSVACENQPPAVVSRPPTVAYRNEPYLYAVRAIDPEGDPLTFTLESGPVGMTFTPGTSLLRWTPTVAQAGPQPVVILVTDAAGNVARQTFTVVVSTESPNRPPVITSRPPTSATLGRAFTYAVAARDPDGDPLTFALTEKPAGMEIDPTGVITWTPTVAGSHLVTVEVTDGRAGVAVQTFTLTARPNAAPVITPFPGGGVPDATFGATFRTRIPATDPEGDPLTFTLTQAPPGMTIDGEGRITWTVPTTGDPRTETVRVVVTDSDGLPTSVEFEIDVIRDTTAPMVRLALSSDRVNLGTTVQVTVQASDNVGVTSVTLTADGVAVPLDSQNRAFLPASVAGRVTFVATATDASGNVGTATADLRVIDPTAVSDVRTRFTRLNLLTGPGTYQTFIPDDNAVPPDLGYLTDVYGTVSSMGQPLEYWRLLVARGSDVDIFNPNPDSPAWREIGRGSTTVTDGKLGTFDPTMLPNDRYVLALVAYDATGAGYVKPTEVNVVGSAKLGDFRLEFTDLNLPLNGIPIQITRVYDTKESTTSKDFGFGWSLGLRDARIRETVPANQSFIPDKTKVYLTAPDGTRVGFTYKETVTGGAPFGLATYFATSFKADAGHTYKLELPDEPTRIRGIFGNLAEALGGAFNPSRYRLTSPDGTKYDYDQTAGLQKITDMNGNTVTFTDTAITHSGGSTITMERDGTGRITAIRLPDGSVAVRYRYNAAGDLIEVKQVTETTPVEKALTSTIQYRTDRAHYLDEYTDANGNRAVKVEYDASGRLKGVTDANGNTSTQDFDPTNFAETVKDARGNPTTITYNERGNVTKTVQATEFGDVVTLYAYDDPRHPDKETSVTDGRGNVTAKTFDAAGNTLTDTTADGTTTYKYNAQNKLTKVTDTLGRTTVYDYNSAGNLIRVLDPRGDGSTFEYDNEGHVKTFTDFAGNVTTFADYCSCGRPLTTINPDGSIRRIKTNQYSQITESTDERGNVTKNDYDNQGRLIAVTDGEGGVTRYEYVGTNQTKVTDPLGNVTRYEYDSLNRRTKIIDAEGGATAFTYDANGNLATVTDPVNNVTRFLYDAANRLKEEIDPLNKSRFFEYDAAGNRVKATDRNGRVRTFEYDALNRQTAEKWLDGSGTVIRNITSEYDKAGNLLKTADPDAVLTYTYDVQNRVKTATTVYVGTSVPSVTLTYDYDDNGNRKSVASSDGVRVDSTYDNRNRLDTRTWTGGGISAASVNYDYYANGERQALTRYADVTGTAKVGTSTYDYWKNGLSKTITHADGAGAVLAGYGYTYDSAGRLIAETHHGESYAYGYDKTGQLTSVAKNGAPAESFGYDDNGNRETSTGHNGSQTYAAPGAGNRLLNDGLFAYTYDGEGNLTTKTEHSTGNVTEYTWDHRNRLVKVEQRTSGGVMLSVSEYVYDAQNRRIAQIVNGQAVFTVYDREHAWADYTAAGAVANRFLFGDGIDDILARWTPGTGTAWHLSDKLGTVRDVLNAAGAVVNHIDYSAFGEILSQTNAAAGDRFTFTGREWDAAIGDYFYRARYYDPTAGRFTSEDPIGFDSSDSNLFRYAANLPVAASDPTGFVTLFEYVKINAARLGPTLASLQTLGLVVGSKYQNAAAFIQKLAASAGQTYTRFGQGFDRVGNKAVDGVRYFTFQTNLGGGRVGAESFARALVQNLTSRGSAAVGQTDRFTVILRPDSGGGTTVQVLDKIEKTIEVIRFGAKF